MKSEDTNGDLYEYMLSKGAAAGQNGQFRTSRHISELMVAMTGPRRDDVICDPASGTVGFLVGAADSLRRKDADALTSGAVGPLSHVNVAKHRKKERQDV